MGPASYRTALLRVDVTTVAYIFYRVKRLQLNYGQCAITPKGPDTAYTPTNIRV